MIMFLIIFSHIPVSFSLTITCNKNLCPDSFIGDGHCDQNCMNPYCNYDSKTGKIADSDCYSDCIYRTQCQLSKLGDGTCNSECNSWTCAYDLGDCGKCSSNCYDKMLGSSCYSVCNTASCYYGLGLCQDCSQNCPSSLLGDGNCDSACDVSSCNYDFGDCQTSACASGCYINMLNNTVCDKECYNEECGWDGTDCDCSPGCTLTELNNSGCDAVCNVAECDFDSHACGDCASGCFDSFIGNGTCESACNNENCNWDGGDCQCASTCNINSYGNCSEGCMVADCLWDQISTSTDKRCSNTDLSIFYMRLQLMNNNFTEVPTIKSCLKKTNCTAADLAVPETCSSDCNNDRCWWSQYNCFPYNETVCADSNCLKCYGDDLGMCYECDSSVSNNYQFFGYCVEECPTGYEPLHFLEQAWICVLEEDKSTADNPAVYYVDWNTTDSLGGDGTIAKPWKTLSLALASISTAYSIVYLTPGYHYLTEVDKNSEIYVTIADASRPYNYQVVRQNLTITSSDSSTPTIKPYPNKDTITITLENTVYMSFTNINFDAYYWESEKSKCNSSSEYCSYCPYVTQIFDGTYQNDRGEAITEFLDADECAENHGWNLFEIPGNCSLLLKNVNFTNWRLEENSLISSNGGNLDLESVDFSNIRTAPFENSSVIIFADCGSATYECGNFQYNKGNVEKLNNGFEYDSSLILMGFLRVLKAKSVSIANVNFKNNFISDPEADDAGSVLYLEIFRTLYIEKCEFSYNYVQNGIIFILASNLALEQTVDNNEIIDYTIDHVTIKSSKFYNNYGINIGIIAAYYVPELQNYHIDSLDIQNNVVESGSFFVLNNTVVKNEYIYGTTGTVTTDNGYRITAHQNPRWFNWYSGTIKNNYSGSNGIFYLTKIFNIFISGVTIDSNGDTERLNTGINVNTIVFNSWINNPDMYMKDEIKTNQLTCEYMSAFSIVTNITIKDSEITNNYCSESNPVINFDSSNVVNFTNTTFNSNYGWSASLSTVLYINNGNQTGITSSKFLNNTNYADTGYGLIYAKGSSQVLEVNSTLFYKNYASEGGIYFVGSIVKLYNDTFEYNGSPTHGAGLYISQLSSGTLSVYADSCTFYKSSSINGGAVYMENEGISTNTIYLAIKNTTFESNYGEYGSVIYLEDSIAIAAGSFLYNCTFKENTAKISGAIAALYSSGTLSISNSVFYKNTARLGSAIYLEIGPDLQYSGTFYIENTEFLYNSGGAVLYASNADIFSFVVTKSCSFLNNVGSAVFLDYDSWVDNGSIIKNNSGMVGGGLRMDDNASASLTATIFEENNSSSHGGAISVAGNSNLTCNYCSFQKNFADDSGGAIYNEQDSVFNVSHSVFEENISTNKGSAVYLLGSPSPVSQLHNVTIASNYAYNEGSVALLDSAINITSSKVHENSAKMVTGGVLLTLSTATITKSTFYSQQSVQGSFLYATTQSTAIIQGCFFNNGKSSNSGGAVFSTASEVIISSCTFSGNFAYSGGGGSILSYSGSSLNITDSKFINSSSNDLGGVIVGYESNLYVENSYFDTFSMGAISGEKMMHIWIKGSQFYNGYSPSGGALSCTGCVELEIYDSEFIKNRAKRLGGALYIWTTNDNEIANSYIISNTMFQNNRGEIGGSIYSNNVKLNISFSTFSGNSAITDDPITATTPVDGNGGAINTLCEDFKTCEFYFSSNTFVDNFATYDGGALNFEDIMPVLSGNVFANNTAAYGDDIGSYAVKIVALDENGELIGYQRRLESAPLATSLSNLAPGQTSSKTLKIALVDYYNNIVTTDSSSSAELLVTNSSTTTFSGTTKVTAAKGVYVFNDFIVWAIPGTDVDIEVYSTGIDSTKSNSSQITYISTVKVNISLRKCIIGEATVGNNCQVCDKGSYSLDGENTACIDCPSEAKCYGNYTMVPLPGYWRSSNMSSTFWACPKKSACEGSSKEHFSLTGRCEEGYHGNMCQACYSGYSRTNPNTCGKCPDPVSNAFRVIGIVIAAIIVGAIMVRTSRNSAYKPKSIESVYIKIFVNYLQLVILITTFNLEWPDTVLQLFSVQSSAGSVSDEVFSFDCFLDTGEGMEQVYFNKLIIMSVIPIAIGCGSLLFWVCMMLHRGNFLTFTNDLVSTIVILLFLIHPNLVKVMFSSFSCREIDVGEFWLVDNLEIRCWDDNHLFYIFAVSIPSIIVWGIGIPTVSLFFLWKNRRHLNALSIRLRFGFLFNGYKARKYYWEFLILYRKILIVCCSVFLQNISTDIQALTVMVLLLFCLIMQSQNQPYDGSILNQMEIRSILVATITIYCGLYYLTGALNEATKVVFFIAIVLVNAYFIYYWVLKMFGAGIQYLSEKIPFFRNRFHRKVMDGFDDALFEENIERHVMIKGGEKIFSIVKNSPNSLSENFDAAEIFNLNMKQVFMSMVKKGSEENKLFSSFVDSEEIHIEHPSTYDEISRLDNKTETDGKMVKSDTK
ncbi:unnamed protein product [Blepharisma stoltei]|uniref:LNR domain-containing protein n=1 Tax=Blepharisma stoltei TaxID=1481888 RepID=A0AAU9JLY9_9CILI|nr:unnamed protein product [Blepharisma stoltei]